MTGSDNASDNKRGDLTGLTDPYAGSFAWSYLDNGWLNTQQVGNAATTTYTLNALGQIVDQATNKVSGGTLLSDFSSQGSGHYDGAGDLLGLTASLPAVSSYSGTISYGYDTVSQLNQESSTRTGGYSESFVYDAAGNPTTFRGAGQGYNSDNQNTALTFDGDGNPTSWSGQTLTFDANSDLTALGSTLTAGYNAQGLRAWKQTSAGKTYFLYAGGTPVCELDGNGNVLAANTWGVDGLLSRHTVSTGSSVFYTWDRQGGCAQRLDSSGNILGSDAFDGYGNRQSTDNSADPYSGYGGQWGYYRDSETGLSLLGARYYDPGQGRFLNRDPIGYEGGFNLYGYAANNPTGLIDPGGLDTLTLPPNPSGLPPGWRQIQHGDPNKGDGWNGPNGEQRWIGPSGDDGLEFHPAKPGGLGEQGKDHWHKLLPRPGKPGKWDKQDVHYEPGQPVEVDPAPSLCSRTGYDFTPNPHAIQKGLTIGAIVTGFIIVGGIIIFAPIGL